MLEGTPMIRREASCAVTLDGRPREAVGFHGPHLLLELLGLKVFSFL